MGNNIMTNRIEVGDLTARHLGQRVLITDGDSVVEGTIESFWVDHTYKREPKLNYLEVKTENGEYKLKNAPVDYAIQIDTEPAEGGE